MHADAFVAYDEEDGDFVFTRGSKRTKTAPADPENVPALAPAPSVKKPRKPKEQLKQRDDETTATEKKSRGGRKMSFSTPKADSDVLVVAKKRETTRSSTGYGQKGESSMNASRADPGDFDSIDMVGDSSVDETNKSIEDHG